MKFSCDKDKLHQAVQIIQRGISSKTALPILTGILLQANDRELVLRSTDLELSIRFSIPAQVEETGATVVSARFFSDIVRRLPSGTVDFRQTDQLLTLSYSESEFSLNTWSAEEFPGTPCFDTNYEIFLESPFFRSMIKSVAFAASHDENRPLFTACFIDVNDNEVSLVATDTHRLAWKKFFSDAIKAAEPVSSLIPARAFLELARFLDSEEERVRIGFAETYAVFEVGPLQIISRLIEGKFPNYKQVVPASFETVITVPRQELTEAVERASVLVSTRDGASIVKLDAAEGRMTITSKALEIGALKEVIPVSLTGEACDVSFNSRYLLEGMKALETENMIIKLNGSCGAGIIIPDQDEEYIYLVLPVRTQA